MSGFRKLQPDLVVIEGYAFGARGRAITGLAELRGVVLHALWRREAPWVEIPPTQIKLEATGNGKANKQEMFVAAQRLWPACPGYDEADAFWCAVYGSRFFHSLISPA